MNAELRKHVANHSHSRVRVATAVKVGVCNPQNDYRNNRSKNAFHKMVTFGNRFRSTGGPSGTGLSRPLAKSKQATQTKARRGPPGDTRVFI
jgi:hypothetical protein